VRYPLVGGRRQRHFGEISLEPRKLLENVASPICQLPALLGSTFIAKLLSGYGTAKPVSDYYITSRDPQSETTQPNGLAIIGRVVDNFAHKKSL
jgi:hypothetical protein